MDGLLLVEFLDFVEEQFGSAVYGHIVAEGARRAAQGIDRYAQLRALVDGVERLTGTPYPDLWRRFGRYLFPHLTDLFPAFVEGADSTLALLNRMGTDIGRDLGALYPDTEYPVFESRPAGSGTLEIVYCSPRGLGDLAQGLIEGCADYFGEEIRLQRENLVWSSTAAIRFRVQVIGRQSVTAA